jgi:hypothetical protein
MRHSIRRSPGRSALRCHRGELDQHAVTSCLDDAPAVLGNGFVLTHQARVPDDVCGEDGG